MAREHAGRAAAVCRTRCLAGVGRLSWVSSSLLAILMACGGKAERDHSPGSAGEPSGSTPQLAPQASGSGAPAAGGVTSKGDAEAMPPVAPPKPDGASGSSPERPSEPGDLVGELCSENRVWIGSPLPDEALFGLRGTIDGRAVSLPASAEDDGSCSGECVVASTFLIARGTATTYNVENVRLALKLAELSEWVTTFMMAGSMSCELFAIAGPTRPSVTGQLIMQFVAPADGTSRGSVTGSLRAALLWKEVPPNEAPPSEPSSGLVRRELELEFALPWTVSVLTSDDT